MSQDVFLLHGPAVSGLPVVLDSPHSGTHMPADFGAAVSEAELRDGEDCYIDQLWLPATDRGISLLAAQCPRTYIDLNRHEADIDLDLIEGGTWPGDLRPSGKAHIGKALIWRTLDDARPIYARRLGVAEVRARIERVHRPYHQRLRTLLDASHAAHGRLLHINCHSMNAVAGVMGEGGAGRARADIVLGDRDGSCCAPALTERVRALLVARGYEVAINDPFKGVELVRAYADPARGRHSLQLEVNKRLYMDERTLERTPGYARLQADLMHLLDELCAPGLRW